MPLHGRRGAGRARRALALAASLACFIGLLRVTARAFAGPSASRSPLGARRGDSVRSWRDLAATAVRAAAPSDIAVVQLEALYDADGKLRLDVERALKEACMPFYIFSATMGAEEASAKIAKLLPGQAGSFAADSPRLKVGSVTDATGGVAGRAPPETKLHLFALSKAAEDLKKQDAAGRWIAHDASSQDGLQEMTETLIWGLYMNGVMDGCSDEIDPVTGKLSAN